jgi:peptide/nickel transport system permease protein
MPMTETKKNAPKPASLLNLGLRRLRQSSSAMVGLYVLITLYFCAVFADFIAPYNYDTEVREASYCPPNLHFVDAGGGFHIRPFVYQRGYYRAPETRERLQCEDQTQRYPIRFLVHGESCDEHKLLLLFKTRWHLFGVGDPVPDVGPPPPDRAVMSAENPHVYLMGADDMGEDVFSRILYGARISMTVGLIGSAITFILGMLVGGISGYYGGIADNALQRLCEMMMMIPGFYLMLALRMAMPTDLSSTEVYLFVVFILSFIGWAGGARVIRGIVLSIRTKDYVVAARASGVPNLRIIVRHILPNTLSYAIVSVTLGIPGYILGESALSLLGLGIQRPQASWGNMLSDAMNVSQIQFHPWVLIPGVFIFLAVMAFNLLGDGLRDAFDPQGLIKKVEKR